MSILLPTLDYPPRVGGVARYLQAMKKTLGDDLDVLFFDKPTGRLKLFLDVLKAVSKHEAIWVSHVLPLGTVAMYVSIFTRKPYTVFLHGLDFDLARRSAWKRRLTRSILRSAQRVVANSHALADEVRVWADLERVEVVYPCVDDAFVESASFMRHRSSENEQIQLLTVGRLVERKGHMQVLNVVKNLSDVHYTIVGDGPMRSRLEERVAELGLEDRVTLLQAVSDRKLPALYSATDIFVMPTLKTDRDREGFGIVYLEAQLFGVPVVAMRHPGIDEAVKGGVLIDSIDELSEALSTLIDDPDRRMQLGKDGRAFVLESFTREKSFGKLRGWV